MGASPDEVAAPDTPMPSPRLCRTAALAVFFALTTVVAVPMGMDLLNRDTPCPPVDPMLQRGIDLLGAGLMTWPLVAVILALIASARIKRSGGLLTGRGTARASLYLVVIGFIVVAIIVPSRMGSMQRMRYSMVTSDTKTAVNQAGVYASDKGGYPGSLKALREAGYANVSDADPWGTAYLLAPVFTRGGKPQAGEDVYIYSKGPCGTGAYTPRAWKRESGTTKSGAQGAAGYSSIYGTFEGS